METLAAPLMPCCRTAAAMKKMVTLLVPPMSRGLRPRVTVMGAVMTEVRTPSMGGKSHGGGHRQTVGECYEGGDDAAETVACE